MESGHQLQLTNLFLASLLSFFLLYVTEHQVSVSLLSLSTSSYLSCQHNKLPSYWKSCSRYHAHISKFCRTLMDWFLDYSSVTLFFNRRFRWYLLVYLHVQESSRLWVLKETRPDTRLPQSRAGGQGPYFRSVEHLGRSGIAKNPINAEKVKCDGRTYGRTDQRTNGWTDKAGFRVA